MTIDFNAIKPFLDVLVPLIQLLGSIIKPQKSRAEKNLEKDRKEKNKKKKKKKAQKDSCRACKRGRGDGFDGPHFHRLFCEDCVELKHEKCDKIMYRIVVNQYFVGGHDSKFSGLEDYVRTPGGSRSSKRN